MTDKPNWIEQVLHEVYMEHADSTVTTTLLHDMAETVAAHLAQQPSRGGEDALAIANSITKALLPSLYGKPGLSNTQVLQLMGTREVVYNALKEALAEKEGGT